jgi:hypothetical protein
VPLQLTTGDAVLVVGCCFIASWRGWYAIHPPPQPFRSDGQTCAVMQGRELAPQFTSVAQGRHAALRCSSMPGEGCACVAAVSSRIGRSLGYLAKVQHPGASRGATAFGKP